MNDLIVDGVEFRGHPDCKSYMVGNDGSVWSSKQGRWRKLKLQLKNGYATAWINRSQEYVHRLVLSLFDRPQPVGQECRHLDGNKLNNSLSNLAWGTRKENMSDMDSHGRIRRGERATHSILTSDDIRKIRLLREQGMLQREIAETFGITRSHVNAILHRYQWRHV